KIYFSNRDSLEWATPVLYMQVPDGQLFQFRPRTAEPAKRLPEAVPEEAKPVPAIALLKQTGSGREIRLGTETVSIGRGEDNDISFDEPEVSRKHAVLTRSGETYVLESSGSSGTLVNGKRIEHSTVLAHNDEITIGATEFKFCLLADVAAGAKRKAGKKRVRRSETVTVEPKEKESFAGKAARSYEAGVQFMIRGNWPEAIAAFNSARTYVPGYQDVDEKISVCEFRYKVARLYLEAQQLCAQKNYDAALQALGEA